MGRLRIRTKKFFPNSFFWPKEKAFVTTYVLGFGLVFFILVGGLFGFIIAQMRQSQQKVAWNEALEIAEAGINYYYWCLNNEKESFCQNNVEYLDLAGNSLGSFSLEISSTISCGQTVTKNITSTGRTNNLPDLQRKVKVLYTRPSVGRYAYLLNDNVWVGADHEVRGLYHSNGGIRMDGENQSQVTSAQETWLCTSSFGCDPLSCPQDCLAEGNSCRCPGVFTTTQNPKPDLFQWPVPSFDFDGITIDLAQLKSIAQPYLRTKYWPASSTLDNQGKGYHITFLNNGTFEVRLVTRTSSTRAYSLEDGWHYDYFIISGEYLLDSVALDSSCPILFFEDNVWIEGEVKGKVTLASANLIDPNKDADVVLPGNINYTTLAGSDGLAIVGQRNILIGPNSPDEMELRGIFVAQKGRFGRNHYPNNTRSQLEIYGSIVSNGRVGTKWVSGSQILSGYLKRETYTDSYLIYNPPAFLPYVSPDFKILNWEEVD